MLNFDAATTFSFFSSSTLRYALLIPMFHPNFLPHPALLYFLSRLYSASLPPSPHQVSASDNHNVDDAVASFTRMLSMRHRPPIIEFNKILGSLVKINHYPTAITSSGQCELRGIVPDIVTFNIVINCYYHLGHLDLAFSVFAKILKMGYQPNTITLNTLMKVLCLNGEVDIALHFHDRVVALGFQLNEVSYRTLINGLRKIGQRRAAVQLLR